MPARSTLSFAMSDLATILCQTLKCLPSPMWTGKIRIQFMNSWRAGVLQLGQNSLLLTCSTMSPTTKMTLGGLSKIKQILLWTHSRWNFEKFLVNHKGQPVRRYDKSLNPSKLVSIFRNVDFPSKHLFQVPDIDVLLEQCLFDTCEVWAELVSWTSTHWKSNSEVPPRQPMTSLDSSLAVLMAMVLQTFGLLCIRVFVLQGCWWREDQ